ncbi:hypothetical protein [Arthrobacter sp. H5]|uniref:hypothetical protein n=1 Tax=Arthrobacter sp. H5 TaxID=1267973 RepID=UPI000482CE52|nr:hypothetical protein [Arthrobacter sp. H5]
MFALQAPDSAHGPLPATRDKRGAAFEAELASVVAHVLLLAVQHEVDVVGATDRNWLSWMKAS